MTIISYKYLCVGDHHAALALVAATVALRLALFHYEFALQTVHHNLVLVAFLFGVDFLSD